MIAESADIKFACSQCGQRIVVDKSAAGLSGTCPICEGPVVVPHASVIEDHPSDHGGHASGERESYVNPGLDETREELFSTSVELGQLQRELDEAKREIERQRSLFKKAVDECERVTASATHAQAEIKSFQADRQQLKSDLAQVKQRALHAENQVAELATALAAANHENAALREKIDNDLSLSHSRLEATETQLDVRERELAGVRDENSQIVQSLAGTQAELAALGAELAGVREQLSTTLHSLHDAHRAGEQLSEEKRELEFQLHQSTSEGQRLRQELEALSEHAEVLRRDLVTTDAGQELLDLRSRLSDITDDRAKIAETLAEKRAELKALTATEEALRGELAETRRQREAAEQQAAANSELQLNKDNEVLRGIVARQNTTLGVYYAEVRRLRRGRFGLRIVYGLFALALLILVGAGVLIFTHEGQGAGEIVGKLLH